MGAFLGQFFGLDGQGRSAEVIEVGSLLKSVPNGVVDLGVLPGVYQARVSRQRLMPLARHFRRISFEHNQ